MHATYPLIASFHPLRAGLFLIALLGTVQPLAIAQSPAPTRLGAGGRTFGDLVRSWRSEIRQASGQSAFDQLELESAFQPPQTDTDAPAARTMVSRINRAR